MTDVSMSVTDTEPVLVPVSTLTNGVPTDPTGNAVQMGFAPAAGTVTYFAATWETWPGPAYYAKCSVGPTGTATLTPGTYEIWVSLGNGVKRAAGTLTIRP
ncbi:MAG TPA: hypothetical protein VGH54_12150 [Mycobacterium sp.]|uniref:hypothetical protein n=1 Tax=Mycobacterium sp. TaxID=1785 RepID=UPI002F404EF8